MFADLEVDEAPLFAAGKGAVPATAVAARPWKVLLVDDERAVHDVTRLALSQFEFEHRPLEFLHAYSAAEAEAILVAQRDVAVAFVDVVMETDHAGLDLVRSIRGRLENRMLRIILRTGQPGQAPESRVIRQYDINDYKEKTELTTQKLYSTMLTSLRSYRDLQALEASRRGLKQVIEASGEIFRARGMNALIRGVLEQLAAILYLDADTLIINLDSVALGGGEEQLSILAATGRFAPFSGHDARGTLPAPLLGLVEEALHRRGAVARAGEYAGYFSPRPGHAHVIYVTRPEPLSEDERDLIGLFLHNASIACENSLLRDEIEGTQRDIIDMLGEAIETRSRETGQHVRRVSEYCGLIARGIGLSEREAEILRMAAPLHDFGKIGIPDAVLHKPGKLDDAEWAVMKTHAGMGEEMLARSGREILKAAAIVAGHHHERWDGKGYPRGLAGESIPLYGRIAALADVIDALASRRCYKEPWLPERIAQYLVEQRGAQFDPQLVDWVTSNWERMLEIGRRYADA